jgi:hypothetical protein
MDQARVLAASKVNGLTEQVLNKPAELDVPALEAVLPTEG